MPNFKGIYAFLSQIWKCRNLRVFGANSLGQKRAKLDKIGQIIAKSDQYCGKNQPILAKTFIVEVSGESVENQ